MQKLLVFVAFLVLPLSAQATSPCAEANMASLWPEVSELNVWIEGFDGIYRRLEMKLTCRDEVKDGDEVATPELSVVNSDFFRPMKDVARGVTLDIDDISGEIEAEAKLFLAKDDKYSGDSYYVLKLRWNERLPGDLLHGQKLLFFRVSYTLMGRNEGGGFAPVPGKQDIPLRIDAAKSKAKFGGYEMSLETNPLLRAGTEKSYVRRVAGKYGRGLAERRSRVRSCMVKEVEIGAFEATCKGEYDSRASGGARVQREFRCDFKLAGHGDWTEVVDSLCLPE